MYAKLLFDRLINFFSNTASDASRALKTARVQPKVRILFVCMGNICRSPMARGVFEKLLEESRAYGRRRGRFGRHLCLPRRQTI